MSVFESIGPKAAMIDGKAYMLQSLTPEGLACVVDHALKLEQESALDRVMKSIEKYPSMSAEAQTTAIEMAIKLDDDRIEKEKYSDPEKVQLPKAAMLAPSTVALIFHLAAHSDDPSVTLDFAKQTVEKMGALAVLAAMSLALPGDSSKKDQSASSDSSGSGADSIGLNNLQKSVKRRNGAGLQKN